MTTYTLYKIAKALQVSTDYLMTGKKVSNSSDTNTISLLFETLSSNEREIAKHLIQTYLRDLSAREATVTQYYEKTHES